MFRRYAIASRADPEGGGWNAREVAGNRQFELTIAVELFIDSEAVKLVR
jgi:hypothetical protein